MRGSHSGQGRDRVGAIVASLAVTAIAAAPIGAAAADGPQVLFRIQPAEIDESSSLVVSQTHPGLVYTANDSGGSATVYVLNSGTGALVGETSLAGVEPLDIEAMTPGPDESLIVADIGDNNNERPYVTVYRIDQPGRGTQTVNADAVRVTYSDGPHNAESAVYDDASGRLFIVSKQFAGAHVYRSPRDVFSHQHVVMRPVARAPFLATDAALLPSGDVAVIRTYFTAFFYTFPGWRRLADRGLPKEPQGESLGAPASGDTIWIGSEGEHSRVLAVGVPDLTPPTPTTSPPTSSSPPDGGAVAAENERTEHLKSRAVLVGGAALLLFVVVVAVIAVRWHRHPHVD